MRYALGMSDGDSHRGREVAEGAWAQLAARWEAVETLKARELASMTEERAREIIRSLAAAQTWRERPDWSGLVEQQAFFHRRREP